MSNYYKVGSHNVICDNCQAKRKREQVRKTWDGFMMCYGIKNCWSPKHPNETPIPVIVDGLPVYDARPRTLNYLAITSGTSTWETANWNDSMWTWDDDNSSLSLFANGGTP